MEKEIKIIICGVNFGKFYIDVCSKSENMELKGILSQGSEESKKIAQIYNVPLYVKMEDIPINDVDLFIAATRSLITGGRSSNIVKSMLETGISVIQEQPVHIQEVRDILKSIQNEKQGYYVNNFYRYQPTVKKFLEFSKRLGQKQKFLRLRLSCSSQLLYPLIDVVYDMFDGINQFEVKKVEDGNMNILTGSINNIPYVINYYNEYSSDNDGGLALFFDIKVDTALGNLVMNDPEGSIVWQSHLMYNRDWDFSADIYKNVKPIECLFDGNTESYLQRYKEVWPMAIEESIQDFYKKIGNKSSVEELIRRTEKQCEICAYIANAAGRPRPVQIPYREVKGVFDNNF